MFTLKKTLPRIALACAVLAGCAAAPAFANETGGIDWASARHVHNISVVTSVPESDNPDLRTMPVERGSYQQYLR